MGKDDECARAELLIGRQQGEAVKRKALYFNAAHCVDCVRAYHEDSLET